MVETGVNPICLLFNDFIVEEETAEAKEKVAQYMKLIEQNMGIKLSLALL